MTTAPISDAPAGIIKQPGIDVLYSSGPMSRVDEFNYPAFHSAAADLRAAGYTVYSPAEDADGNPIDRTGLTGFEKAEDIGFDLRAAFADYARHITTDADAIAVLPGWETSPGARGEVALGLGLGLPVIDALTGEFIKPVIEVQAAAADGNLVALRSDVDQAALAESMDRHPAGKGRVIQGGLPLIGLSGYAQTGKDTVGEILVRDHGYRLVSPSNVLREFLYAQELFLHGGPDEFGGWQPPTFLNTVVDTHGWEMARRLYPEIRVLQQKTGTEAGREVLHYDVWLAAMADRFMPGAPHVSASVRFHNEAQFVLDRGGIVVRVNRPGVEPVNAHASDTMMDDWNFDYVIDNDGTLEDLAAKVADVLADVAAKAAASQ